MSKDYFDAYKARLESVNQFLLNKAKELTQAGFDVYHTEKGLVKFICIFDKNDFRKNVCLSFEEVPYRWSFHTMITPSKERSSSRHAGNLYFIDEPTKEYIIDKMKISDLTKQAFEFRTNYLTKY
jgi:hypothetical protein